MIKTLLVLSGAVLLAAPSLLAQGRHYDGGARPSSRRGLIAAVTAVGYGYVESPPLRPVLLFRRRAVFLPVLRVWIRVLRRLVRRWVRRTLRLRLRLRRRALAIPARTRAAWSIPMTATARPRATAVRCPKPCNANSAKKGLLQGQHRRAVRPGEPHALSRFQREHNLKETGRIDEPTLDALGFTDQR